MGWGMHTVEKTFRVNAGEEVFLRYDMDVTPNTGTTMVMAGTTPVFVPTGTGHSVIRRIDKKTAEEELSYCSGGSLPETTTMR